MLPTTRLTDAVSVPVIALQSSTSGSFVFVVKPDKTVEQRSVTTGATSADRAVIDKGLEGGERVVTEGQMLLVDGARDRIDKG
jgi:multidrug efflux system membrane fusion protein